MENQNSVSLRSKEADELLSVAPKGVLRWGIPIVFIVLLGLLFATEQIKYQNSIKYSSLVEINGFTKEGKVTLELKSPSNQFLLNQSVLIRPDTGFVYSSFVIHGTIKNVISLGQKTSRIEVETTSLSFNRQSVCNLSVVPCIVEVKTEESSILERILKSIF